MSPDEFDKARESVTEELTNHWAVVWDSNCLDDTSTTEVSLVNDCTAEVDDGGNLFLMRGDKTLGIYASGQWRKAARLVLRRYDGEVVELPVDSKEEPTA